MKENFGEYYVSRFREMEAMLVHKKTYGPDVVKGLEVTYNDENLKNMVESVFPLRSFNYLILTKRPDLVVHFPYNVEVHPLERGDNAWLQETHYRGINYGENLKLYLATDREHTEAELLWILLHEFRHKMQWQNYNINSCQNNENLEYLYKLFPADMPRDIINHVLHELLPYEVDANTFACEIMDMPYPGSKFEITDERFKLVKTW